MSSTRRTAIERAVLDDGLSIGAAVKNAAVDQIGRLADALDREVTRIAESDGPLDTTAALRVARTWRQLVPIMEMQDRAAPSESAQSKPAPPSLAQQIAAQERVDPQRHNGHPAAATS